jgi:hypothetical protein
METESTCVPNDTIVQKLRELAAHGNELIFKELLQVFSSEFLYEEAFNRLQDEFEKENRKKMKYGDFRWVVHDGRLQAIFDYPKNRRYRSQYVREHGSISE